MTIKEAFNQLLYTRGALVKLGVKKGNVGNMKKRIQAGNYPMEATMYMYLSKAGWKNEGDNWTKE